MNRIGIGLIGCGYIAWQRYVPMLAARRDARVVAVCTRRPETARRAAQQLGGAPEAGTDVDRLLSNPRVDAVIITTPHKLHALQAAAALDAGKHVLVEKPLATSWEDARRVVDAARRSRAVAVILPYQERRRLDAIAGRLDPASFGRIASVSADFSGPGPRNGPWKFTADQAGRGVIVAQAVYALDLIAAIMGPARRITAAAGTLIEERDAPGGGRVRPDVEDSAAIVLEYASGQYATVRSCWAYPRLQAELSIQGTRGRLTLSAGAAPGPGARWRERVGRALRGDPAHEHVSLPPERESVVDHFLRCIRTGAAPATPLEQAAHVTEQMMLAYESARSGRVQALTTTFTPRLALPRALFEG